MTLWIKKSPNVKIMSNGKAMFVEGSNEYLAKRGSNTRRENKGPSGRRKTKERNILAKKAVENCANFTKVVWCSDSKGNR